MLQERAKLVTRATSAAVDLRGQEVVRDAACDMFARHHWLHLSEPGCLALRPLTSSRALQA